MEKATVLNYNVSEEVNVNSDASLYLVKGWISNTYSSSADEWSTARMFLELLEEIIVFKNFFPSPFSLFDPHFMGRGNDLWKFHAVLMAVLLRNALQISQQ